MLRADDAGEKPKTGGFDITFSTPSPLTDRKMVAERFGIGADADKKDYSLGSEKFWLYVPPSYDPAKPMGIILMQQQGCHGVTPDMKQAAVACEARNIALISPLTGSIWGYRTAMCVDAVENLKKQYAIDPKRVYVYGTGMQAQRMTLGYPELFAAGCYDLFECWDIVPIPWIDGGAHAIVDSAPPPKWRDQGKGKPLIMMRLERDDDTEATNPDHIDKTIAKVVADFKAHRKDDQHWHPTKIGKDGKPIEEPKHGYQALSLGDRSKLDWDNQSRYMQKIGFSDIRRLEIPAKPSYGEWVAAMIDEMDAPPAKPKKAGATTKPTTAPSANKPKTTSP